MIRTMLAVAALTVFAGTISVADAAPCRDARGKFTKCPSAAPAPAARCKDSKGKFAKCGTAGAGPVKK